jgi:glycosyltransferase involved in cell wall biosynthesis
MLAGMRQDRQPADGPPPGDGPVVDVVLPCLDEAAALPWLLDQLAPGHRAIVVDNGSSDDSSAIAAAAGALVVSEPVRGYGAAVHAGLVAATAPVVAFMDCDGSLDPAELPRMVSLLGRPSASRDGADLVLGRRRPVRRGVWPWHARAGTRLLAALISRGSGVTVHDIAPVRVARRADLLSLDLRDRRCGYPLETIVAAAKRGWHIVEVDVDYLPRAEGTRSKISGTARGTRIAAADFCRVLLRGVS